MLRIGIVAGEVSGDKLGAELIQGLREYFSEIKVEGIGGEALIEKSCHTLYPMEKLSVMGIFEVIRHYPELRSIQKDIIQYFSDDPPDIFIGIDAPDFNLPIEKALKKKGIKTVHYVSPSVWAWREGRINSIAQSVDLMLTLFPFEKKFYQRHQVPVSYVGHPLANEIAIENPISSAREELNISVDGNYLAILPGSRHAEIKHLGPIFLDTLKTCQLHYPKLKGIVGLHSSIAKEQFINVTHGHSHADKVDIFVGKTQTVMAAANVLLIASGTATLEGMLIKRPMVVAYKANWLSYKIVTSMLKIAYVSLPNLLANKELVPELLQSECTVEKLSYAVISWFEDSNRRKELEKKFTDIHEQLRSEQSESASKAIYNLINQTV